MLGIKKLYLAVAGLIGAIAYASQYYSISGLSELKLVPKASSSLSPQDNVAASWKSQNLEFSVVNRSVPSFVDTERNEPKPSAIWPSTGQSAFRNASNSTHSTQTISNRPRIRIASFCLHAFNEDKLQKLPVIETLTRIVRQFDVIAFQHITSRQNDILPILMERINKSDRHYDYCIGPRVGRDQKQQFAFVFDADRIETDRDQLYTVDDPQDLLVYEPLVSWFRTKVPRRDQAFTFTLVNLRLDPFATEAERKVLPDLVRSIRADGRVEDDIILVGEFQSSTRILQGIPGLELAWAIDEISTTVSGDTMTGNILFPPRSTDEFTGRSGVIDFLRQLNLSYDQAMQVSPNLPIWAEFSAYEGGSAR